MSCQAALWVDDQHATSNIPVHGFSTLAAVQHQRQHILQELRQRSCQTRKPASFSFGEEGIKHNFGGANGLVQEMLTRTAKAKDASDKKKKAVSTSDWFGGELMQVVVG